MINEIETCSDKTLKEILESCPASIRDEEGNFIGIVGKRARCPSKGYSINLFPETSAEVVVEIPEEISFRDCRYSEIGHSGFFGGTEKIIFYTYHYPTGGKRDYRIKVCNPNRRGGLW
jgi:hypothetical protein